ncbi:MAG: F420-0--gamma-glutamyl ligase [Thermotogae bacterium]|nr:F420-0--gamma-glutamyl ligase [Thermotogota bacterium]
MELKPNPGKRVTIEVDGEVWARYPIKTHVIKPGEDIVEVAQKYASPYLRKGDYLFISEKVVAIAQGRAYPIDKIKPSLWAKLLSKFVRRTPHGIGLGSPWTMELAIREVGLFRILLAAFVSALTKPFGIRGLFYRVAGKNVAAIDGPTPYTLPPYNRYAKLPPKDPDRVAKSIAERLGVKVVIVDANDLGVEALGVSHEDISSNFVKKVFRDNPLGQASQQTPLCIVRRV